MKLRLRSLESRETQRLEIPSPCTLQQLSQILSQSISSSPSSFHFSLNRKDKLQAPSPDASFQSLGITSGDLIFYSLNPTAFASVQETATQEPPETLDFDHILEPDSSLGKENPLAKQETPIPQSPQSLEIKVIDVNSQEHSSRGCEFSGENQEISVQETPNSEGPRQMEEETQEFPMDIDDGSVDVPGLKTSEPYFLRRVLRKELGDDANAHKLVVIAVHAVLLESGFVGVDMASGKKVDLLQLPNEWPSTTLTMSLWYTLPELLDNGSNNEIESVVLKFQNLGHFVNVYGCLGKGSDSGLHRVCLNEHKFAPIIDLVWIKYDDKNRKLDDKDESKNLCPENEVFEFWKIVKDGLALPLLIEICERTGLSLPACLMRLPTELKIKILEYLPGLDIAKMACVCSEIRYLASNDDLWKKKFTEQFGGISYAPGSNNWKRRFASHWEANKKRKRAITPWYPFVARPFHNPIIRDPYPLGVPPMIGGDYERLPGHGIPFPFGQPSGPSHQPFVRYIGRRSFSPNCNLGGT